MKLLSTAVAICLALSYLAITAEGVQCNRDGLLYKANRNTPSGNRIQSTTDPILQGFSVVEIGFSQRSSSPQAPCDWEGLIEIALPTPAPGGVQDRALGFEFTHVQSLNDLGFPSFHIGDSIDNDAVTAPSSTTHSAEIFNVGRTLKVHANGEPMSPTIISPETDFIDLTESRDITIRVGHQFVEADNGAGRVKSYTYPNQDSLFSLDGSQPSIGVADYKVYLGMNRIIKDQSPSGKGLCNVEVYAYTCN